MEAEAIATVLFRPVEREVRLHHYGLRTLGQRGTARNADAGADVHVVAVDGIRRGDGRGDLGGENSGGRIACSVGLQDRELVAAEAGHHVGRPDGPAQAPGHLAQQRVADRMAEGVVHVLEIVEIETEHREWVCAAPARRESQVEAVEEGPPVGEAGERVLLRQLGYLLVRHGQPVGVAACRPQIGHDQRVEQRHDQEHQPGTIVRRQGPGGNWRHDERPARVAGLELSSPMRPGGKLSPRLWLERRRAQARGMNIERSTIRSGVRHVQIDVDRLRDGRRVDDPCDHRGGQERAVDETDEIAATVLQCVARRVLPVHRQGKKDAVLFAVGAVQRKVRDAGQLVVVAGAGERPRDDRLACEVYAVGNRCLRQRRIKDRQILVLLRRDRDTVVGRNGLDTVAGDAVAPRGPLVFGALLAADARHPGEIPDWRLVLEQARGERLEFPAGDPFARFEQRTQRRQLVEIFVEPMLQGERLILGNLCEVPLRDPVFPVRHDDPGGTGEHKPDGSRRGERQHAQEDPDWPRHT